MKQKPYYDVSLFILFGDIPPVNLHVQFKSDRLPEARELAIDYYYKWQREVAEAGEYLGRVFCSPEEFVEGKSAGWSMQLSLSQEFDDGTCLDLPLDGSVSDEELADARDEEKEFFQKEYGIEPPPTLRKLIERDEDPTAINNIIRGCF